MGIEFYFQYEPTGEYEAEEAAAGYTALVECDADLLKQWGLWKSFIQEYRDERGTYQEWMESTTYEERKADLFQGPPSDEELEALEYLDTWGPSQPFDPMEAKDWASKWIMILGLLSDSEAKTIFPFARDLHTRGAPFGRDFEIRALGKLLAQADCAMQHKAKMTLFMVVG